VWPCWQAYSPTTRANLDQDTFLVTHPSVFAATGEKDVMFIVRSSTSQGIIACTVKQSGTTSSGSAVVGGDFKTMTFQDAAAAVKVVWRGYGDHFVCNNC
jgi:hypothetical protein